MKRYKKRKVISILTMNLLLISITSSVTHADVVPYGQELQSQPSTAYTVNFSDVPQTHWAYNYIAEMVHRNIMTGYPDGKFRPDQTISRAEFATIIVRASGLKPKRVNVSTFADISPTDWESPYVETAKDYLSGFQDANGNYVYQPDAPALREDIAIAIVKLKGYDKGRLPDQSVIQDMFSDYDGISESAKDYVALAVQNHLMSGYPDGTFRPQQPITRAEAATILWRAYQYGSDNKSVAGQTSTSPSSTNNDTNTTSSQVGTTTSTTTNTTTSTTTTDTTDTLSSSTPSVTQATGNTVTTLAGGTGVGDADGPVAEAKLEPIASMVVSRDNSIYFLEANQKKVRKLDPDNGVVSTFKIIDSSFAWEYTSDGTNYRHFDRVYPTVLGYDNATDQVYLGGDVSDALVVYKLQPSVTEDVYSFNNAVNGIENIKFTNDGKVVYDGIDSYWDVDNNGFDLYMYQASHGQQASLLASSLDKTAPVFESIANLKPSGPHDIFLNGNMLYILNAGNQTLYSVQLFPRTIKKVASFENLQLDSVTDHNGVFYASSGNSVYQITTDGKLPLFVDGSKLVYNDGNPVQHMQDLTFDNQGNLLFYDPDNDAIRKINLAQ